MAGLATCKKLTHAAREDPKGGNSFQEPRQKECDCEFLQTIQGSNSRKHVKDGIVLLLSLDAVA